HLRRPGRVQHGPFGQEGGDGLLLLALNLRPVAGHANRLRIAQDSLSAPSTPGRSRPRGHAALGPGAAQAWAARADDGLGTLVWRTHERLPSLSFDILHTSPTDNANRVGG